MPGRSTQSLGMTHKAVMRDPHRRYRLLWERRFYWSGRGRKHMRLAIALASQREITSRQTRRRNPGSFYFRALRKRLVDEHLRVHGSVPMVLLKSRLPKRVIDLAMVSEYQKWMGHA